MTNDVTGRLSAIAGITWAVGLVVALIVMACCLGCVDDHHPSEQKAKSRADEENIQNLIILTQ